MNKGKLLLCTCLLDHREEELTSLAGVSTWEEATSDHIPGDDILQILSLDRLCDQYTP